MAPSNDGLGVVIETALDAVVVMRPDGTIADWNKVAETTFGWAAADVLGRKLGEVLIPETSRAAHYAGLARFLVSGDGPVLRRRIETTALRRDGKEIPVELSIAPFDHGGGACLVGFLRDITERRHREELLQAEARRATLLQRLTSSAAQSASLEDTLKQCLEAVCDMIGWPLGHACLPSRDDPAILVSSVWHCPSGRFAALREMTEAMRFSAGTGLPGEVAQSKEPVWIADLDSSGNFPLAHQGREIEVRSAFAFPIVSHDQIVAVLEFFNDEPTAADENILLIARVLGDQVGRVLERKQEAERKHELLAELNHRVKNMLAVVVGMATQTARNAESLSEFQESFTGRVMSLSRTYSALTTAEWSRMSLADLLTSVLSPYAGLPSDRASIRGPHIALTPKMAIALSVVLHELITNARKFGALATPKGRIEISWRRADTASGPAFALDWREHRPGHLEPPEKFRFGMRLVETSLRHELRGSCEIRFEPDGAHHSFVIPNPM